MKSAAAASLGLVLMTLLLLCGLMWARPFDRISLAMDAVVHAAPKWSQVENLYLDPHTQETSHGADPRVSLNTLEDYWKAQASTPKVLFIGNSQMLAMSLAPGEPPSTSPEKTYVDLLAADFQASLAHRALIYRLAAPGMSYEEALWSVEYVLCHPALRPSGVVLQINYQAFWTGGIRSSLENLLDDSCFRGRIDALANSSQPYSDDLKEAEKEYRHLRDESAPDKTQNRSVAFGPQLESGLRGHLDKVSLYQSGLGQKDDFAQMLYRLRLYVLQVKPSTARSVTGPRLTKSQSALNDIARIAAEAGIRLILFSAPVNPAVSLYSSETDRATYTNFVKDLVTRRTLPFFDFEHAVEGRYWGRQFNSADPLHIGRRGHEIFASDMKPVVEKAASGE
jgi:hypothetical protein